MVAKKRAPSRHGTSDSVEGYRATGTSVGRTCIPAWYAIAKDLTTLMSRWQKDEDLRTKSNPAGEYIAIGEPNYFTDYTLEEEYNNLKWHLNWAFDHCDPTYDFGMNWCLEPVMTEMYDEWIEVAEKDGPSSGEAMDLGKQFFNGLSECMLGMDDTMQTEKNRTFSSNVKPMGPSPSQPEQRGGPARRAWNK